MRNQETSPQPAAPNSWRSGRARRGTTHPCQVCGNSYTAHTVLPGSLMRDNIAALITARLPSWDPAGFICRSCLNRFRAEFVRSEMEKDRGELSAIEEKVVRSLHDGELIADNFIFFFNDTATTEIYTLSLHDALPI